MQLSHFREYLPSTFLSLYHTVVRMLKVKLILTKKCIFVSLFRNNTFSLHYK